MLPKKLVLVPPYDRLNWSWLQAELVGWEISLLEEVGELSALPNETDFLLPISEKLELRKKANVIFKLFHDVFFCC